MVARDKERRTWRRRRTSATHRIFKQLRNQIKLAIKTAKSAYYHRIFDNVRSRRDTSKLRRLGLIRGRAQTSPLPISPEALNALFANVSDVNVSIQRSGPSDLDDLYESQYSDEKFYFNHPTYDELAQTWFTSTSISVVVDGLSLDNLTRTLPVIGDSILHLFSYSIMYEVFPTLWKQALIRPIAKIANPSSASDYRPVSLL